MATYGDNFPQKRTKGTQRGPREPQGWQNARQGHQNGVPGPTQMSVLDPELQRQDDKIQGMLLNDMKDTMEGDRDSLVRHGGGSARSTTG